MHDVHHYWRGIIDPNPLDAEFIDWNEDREEHLARHRVSIYEVQEGVANAVLWMKNLKYGPDRWRLMTFNDAGRPLALFFAYDGDRRALIPITGRTAKPDEVDKYLK